MAGNGELAYTALVANVRLLPIDSDLTQTLRMGSEHVRRRYGVAVSAGTAPILRGVVEQTLGMVPGVARDADRWGGYVAVDETSDLVVGSCAFKGPPTADGTVEIAYYTFGPYEGQGYAKGSVDCGLSLQTAGMLAFDSIILVALFYVDPDLGGKLGGIAILSHAAWDPYYYLRDRVVTSSYLEFCAVCDLLCWARPSSS